VGNHVLAPNISGQPLGLTVSGGTQVGALDLSVEVADGGLANGGTVGPKFTFPAGGSFLGADLITGTIFAQNNSGQQNVTTQSQVYSGSISTASGTVPAAGLLATLNFDTTGIAPGTYSLKLAGFRNGAVSGNTDFGIDPNLQPIPAAVTNGNLIVTNLGDANLDGAVNFSDLLILAQHYGRTSGQTFSTGDFNTDGGVGFDDLLILAQNYGKSVSVNPPPPLTPVPEFVSISLAAAGLLLFRRRRPDAVLG